MSAHQKKIHFLQQEVSQLAMERDQLFQKLGQKRVEMESLSSRYNVLSEENEHLHKRKDELQLRLQNTESTLSNVQSEFRDYQSKMELQSKLYSSDFEDKLQEIQQQFHDEKSQLQKMHQQQILQFQLEKDQENLSKMKASEKSFYDDTQKLQQTIREKEDEIRQLRNSLQEKEQALTNEKVEMEAQKLRMKAQEQQFLATQQELKELKASMFSSTNKMIPPLPHLKPSGNPMTQRTPMLASANTDYSIGDLMADISVPSPMNSEDFNPGAFSIPSSPMVSYTPQLPAHYQKNSAQPGLPTVDEHQPPSHQNSQQSYFNLQLETDAPSDIAPVKDNQSGDIALLSENERLKKVIKEMRLDIEQLQTQMKTASTPLVSGKQVDQDSKKGSIAVDEKKYHLLEVRID